MNPRTENATLACCKVAKSLSSVGTVCAYFSSQHLEIGNTPRKLSTFVIGYVHYTNNEFMEMFFCLIKIRPLKYIRFYVRLLETDTSKNVGGHKFRRSQNKWF